MDEIFNAPGISISLLNDEDDSSVQMINHIIPETQNDDTQSLNEELQDGLILFLIVAKI